MKSSSMPAGPGTKADCTVPGLKSPFVFVGERPSRRAEAIGATWENGGLAGKTLREALLAIGLAPQAQRYLNLYHSTTRADTDRADEEIAILTIRHLQAQGYLVIGLGKVVGRVLSAHGLAHTPAIHPAARGTIRKTQNYRNHLKQRLEEAQAKNCDRERKTNDAK